jgi:hypothetical protein
VIPREGVESIHELVYRFKPLDKSVIPREGVESGSISTRMAFLPWVIPREGVESPGPKALSN